MMARSTRKLQSFAELVEDMPAPTPPSPLFETIPQEMYQGRVAGFEALRDMLLNNWQELARSYNIPLHALLKLVLETDRHALFAMMAEDKLGDADKSKQRALKWFQDYLRGQKDISLSPDTKLEELPSPETHEE